MENVFLCSPTEMDRGRGEEWDQSKDPNGEILIENSFSTVRLCKIVRGSKRDSKFRIKLGPWLLVDSNGTGRGWWSFVSWIVFKGETVPGLMACKWSG